MRTRLFHDAIWYNSQTMPEVDTQPPSSEVVLRLVQGHRDFLGFLERRLPNREAAEEVLQAAFVRTLEKGGALRETESAVAWFYRLLRHALADYYRRGAREARARELQDPTSELAPAPAPAPDDDLRGAVCACMNTLLPNLKSEYAEVLRRVDLDEAALAAVANELGITVNNASVRLHRARQALKGELMRSCGTCATHGCLDCSCGRGRSGA